MRLHHLRLQAFGPFAGVEEIDFDALSADGLHLIHGATGAGKTSILDAICFALFAAVPGGRTGTRDSLRSDHAAPTTRPEVELDFGVGDRRLRVRRSPEHQVPKKRGTGTRAQRGSVQLEELRAGAWTTVSTRADEAAAVIGDLLGMGLSQFAQVMLLPQGEFTAFLRAKADDRSRLLERLFDISDFAAIEQWLIEHRKALESRLVAAEAHRAALIARAQDALSGIPVDEADDGVPHNESAPIDSVDALRAARDRLSERLTTALADADTAEGRAELARTRLSRERSLAGLQQQALAAQQTLNRLADQATAISQARECLDLAARAEACRSGIAALSRRQAAQHETRLAADYARSELAAATSWAMPEEHGGGLLSDTALAPLRERAAAGTDALAGLPELIRQLRALERESHGAAAAHAAAGEEAARSAALVNAGAAQLADLDRQRSSLLPDAIAHPQWRELLGSIDGACRAAVGALGELRLVEALGQQHRSAQLAWVRAEKALLHLRGERLAGIAAELAGDLIDGRPCPVCGSSEHPHPAEVAPGHVDAEHIEAAEETLGAASATAQQVAAHWSSAVGRAQTTCRALLEALDRLDGPSCDGAEVDERVEAARASVATGIAAQRAAAAALTKTLDPGTRTPPEDTTLDVVDALAAALRSAQESVSERTSAAEQAARRIRTIEGQQQAVHAQHATAEKAAATAAETLRAGAARVDHLRDQLVAARHRVDELTHDHQTACGCAAGAEAPVSHTRCVALLDTLVTATTAARAADAECEAARADLDRKLVEHRLPDAQSATHAMLSAPDKARLSTLVETATAQQLKATGVLEQPAVAQAAEAAPAEVDRIASEMAAAELAARHTRDGVADLRRALQTLERSTTELVTHDDQSAPLHAQVAVATSLASAVTGSGDNTLRMRLTAYVLAARLETVTTLANERLAVMTGGRYQLEHTDTKAGRGKSGLGLQVRDAWTGTARETGTLSGGESFIASLALALGLGDAVLQAAGGRHLETLLVDEGFGSLDEDSLEQVLDVLDALRAGGRSVGIVSHVAELRSRIPSQIRVHKSSTGSTLEVVTSAVA